MYINRLTEKDFMSWKIGVCVGESFEIFFCCNKLVLDIC
jgi:hypothetical protein